MKISEMITNRYKLRIPPTVYYDLLADVVEAEEKQEPTTKNDLGVDCISRADAIKAMQNKAKKLKNEDTINGLCGAVAILFDLPSVTPQEPKWIPVSERLPKTDEYVGNVEKYYLAQNEYGDMLVARYTHSEYWEQIYQLKPVADEIVAWMPLPAPFEPQERSDKE